MTPTETGRQRSEMQEAPEQGPEEPEELKKKKFLRLVSGRHALAVLDLQEIEADSRTIGPWPRGLEVSGGGAEWAIVACKLFATIAAASQSK